MHFTWCSVPQTLSVKGQGSNIYMSRFKMFTVKVYWQLKTTMWAIKRMCHIWWPNQDRFYSDELTIIDRSPGEGLWWSEKASNGTKCVKSKQSSSSLLDGERPWLKHIHRDSPRHHIQRVCPEIFMVWGVKGMVVSTGMALCNHCSLCVQRQNIFSSGTATNFALTNSPRYRMDC